MAFPVAHEFIVAAEEALGRALPEPLRSRLSRSNGGEVEAAQDWWTLNPVRDDSDHKRLSRSANDIVAETSRARQWKRFPDGAVAVASNGGGDMLILLPHSGEVGLWDHETGEVGPISVLWG